MTRLPRAELDDLAGGRRHGGVVALAGARRLTPLDALLRATHLFLAMLDGVEDPYNFGQAIRALYAAGAHGLLVGTRDWTNATTVVARASAGASERIAMARVHDAAEAVRRARDDGIRVVTADQRSELCMYDADLTVPLLVVVGGERRGISRQLAKAADLRIAIPYGRAFGESLDTTSATAAIAFEVTRQRSSRACPSTFRGQAGLK